MDHSLVNLETSIRTRRSKRPPKVEATAKTPPKTFESWADFRDSLDHRDFDDSAVFAE